MFSKYRLPFFPDYSIITMINQGMLYLLKALLLIDMSYIVIYQSSYLDGRFQWDVSWGKTRNQCLISVSKYTNNMKLSDILFIVNLWPSKDTAATVPSWHIMQLLKWGNRGFAEICCFISFCFDLTCICSSNTICFPTPSGKYHKLLSAFCLLE